MLLVTAKVTTNMDLETKLAFELTMDLHHKSYKDALELGALSIISDVDPEKASELRIQKMEQMLAEERQALANYKLIKKVKKPEIKKQDEEINKIEQYREEKYQSNVEALKRQAKNNRFQWDTLQTLFRFKNRFETEDYITGRLKTDGYM